MLREFTVRPVLNGYVVSIGCQNMVFTTIRELTSMIDSYLRNPEAVEKAVLETSLNAKHLMPTPDAPTRPAVVGSDMCYENAVPTQYPDSEPVPVSRAERGF